MYLKRVKYVSKKGLTIKRNYQVVLPKDGRGLLEKTKTN